MAVESSFVMNLGAEGVGSLEAGADALDRLGQQIKTDRTELFAMQAALKNMAGSANVSSDVIDKLKDRIAIHKIVIADAQAQYVSLGGSFAAAAKASTSAGLEVAKAADPLRETLDQMARQEMAKGIPRDLKALAAEMVKSTDEANKLKAAIKSLGPETTANTALVKRLTTQQQQHEARLSVVSAKYATLGGDLSKVRQMAVGTQGPFRGMLMSFVETSKESGLLAGKIGTLTKHLGSMSTVVRAGLIGGVLALGVALVALAAGAVAATVGFVRWSLGASNARRELELTLAGTVAVNRKLYTQQDTWKTLGAAIDITAGKFKATTAEVMPLAQRLYDGGLRGRFLNKALDATTAAFLAGGDAAASSTAQMAIGIGNVASRMDWFGARVQKNMGGAAMARALTFDRQMSRLKQNINGLADGLNLDGLAKSFSGLVDVFDKGSASSMALKKIFASILQPFINDADTTTQVVTRMIKGLIIRALDIQIAFLKTKKSIANVFEGSFLANLASSATAMNVLKAAVLGLIVVSAPLLAVLGGVMLAAGIFVAKVVAIGAGIMLAGYLLGNGIIKLVENFGKLKEAFDVGGWKAVGELLIDGLVGGIKAGAGKAVAGVKWLSDKILGAFKSDNEIHSPSARWAREAGEPIPQGQGVGVRRATPAALKSVRTLSDQLAAEFQVPSPKLGVARTNATGGPAGGGTTRGADKRVVHLTIDGVELNVHAAPGQDVKMLAAKVFDIFVEKLEESAVQSGLAFMKGF